MIGYYLIHIFINFNVSSRTPCHSPLTFSIPTADVGCVAWVIRSCSARVSVPGAGTGWSGGGGGSGTAATVWTTSSRPRTRGPAQSSSGSRRPRLEIWEKLGWLNFVRFFIFVIYSTVLHSELSRPLLRVTERCWSWTTHVHKNRIFVVTTVFNNHSWTPPGSCRSSVQSYFISLPINLRIRKTHPPPLPEVSHQATTPFFQSFICYVPFLLSTVHPVIPYSNRNGRSLLTHWGLTSFCLSAMCVFYYV